MSQKKNFMKKTTSSLICWRDPLSEMLFQGEVSFNVVIFFLSFFLSGIFYEKELAEDKEIMKQTQLPSDSLDSIHRESTHSEL